MTPQPPPGARVKVGHVPKAKRGGPAAKKAPQKTCPVCGQQIAVRELREHLRIELLDPRWREQRERASQKLQGSNLMYDEGASIVDNLKKMAEYRTDIFGGEVVNVAQKLRADMAAAQSDAVIWDGHTATVTMVTTRAGGSGRGRLEDQIREMQGARGTLAVPAGARVHGPSLPSHASADSS